MAQHQRRVVQYDYVAQDPEELDIFKKETLTVIDASGLWWKVQNDGGKTGLVPSNYLYPANDSKAPAPSRPTPQFSSPDAACSIGVGSGRTNLQTAEEPVHMYHQPDLMVNRSNGPSLNIVARAKFRYDGKREDELSLEKGDEVVVMEKEADGWWKGRCGTRIGWFPFNYVEEIKPGDSGPAVEPAPKPAAPLVREKKFVCGVLALYSFNSGNSEELTFQKGDLLDIIDQPEDDPDWWEARKATGQTGLIPRNYVEVIHDAEPVFGSTANSGGSGPQSQQPPAQRLNPSAAAAASAQSSFPPPPFAHEVWYHGRVARREAESLLNQRASNGQFIVRSSETKVRTSISFNYSNSLTLLL